MSSENRGDTPRLRPTAPPELDGQAYGCLITGIAVVGDLIVISFANGGWHGPPPPPLFCLSMAWLTASLGLLSVWLGLGRGPLYARLLIAALPCALLVLFGSQGHWHVEAFALIAMFVVAVALPFGLLRIGGLKLRNTNPTAPSSATDEADLGSGQFSLRQMFGWTVAASLVASVGRFLALPAREWVTWGALPVLFSLGALATACAALMPRTRAAVWSLGGLLCVASPALVLGVLSLMSDGRTPNAEQTFWLSFTTDAHVLLMLGVLFIYRGKDYRLTRQDVVQARSNSNTSAGSAA